MYCICKDKNGDEMKPLMKKRTGMHFQTIKVDVK